MSAAEAGFDTVSFVGTEQADAFMAAPSYSSAIISQNLRSADGFESTTIDASAGEDSIWLYDSQGNDAFRLSTEQILAQGPGFNFSIRNVEFAHANSQAGRDQVVIIDQAADRVIANQDSITLQGDRHLFVADGFTEALAADGFTEALAADGGSLVPDVTMNLDSEFELENLAREWSSLQRDS